jgi:glycosyltransferase involved in cell wall biosynthesis
LPVRHLGHIRREFLQVLYSRATALAYFSLCEGLGLPLLEAFQAGTPVVCSNTTSLPETAGDAALTCDPTDVEAISEALYHVVHNQDVRTQLIKRGRERLADFSWQKGARTLLDACRRVATDGNKTRAIRTAVQKAMNRLPRLLPRPGRWIKPTLGIHRQYSPRPLVLPSRYDSQRTPDPAPLISIVTPSFNQRIFLQATMQSVLEQRYPALEYIVQDGGSSDGTVSLLERYAPQLEHWESCPDRGQAHAINIGFRHATGEILAYLNSDDLLLPGSLAYVANYFDHHPEVDVVYGYRIVIDPDGKEVGRCVLPPHDDSYLMWDDCVHQETMFWRRRIWERVGAHLDETYHFALDWDLILRFQKAGGEFACLPRFLGAFRTHTEQKSLARLDLYYPEVRRLRERCHGRPVPYQEIVRARKPYLRRQALFQKLYTFGLVPY